MYSELKKYCVKDSSVILDGIQALERSDEGFAVVVDGAGKVQGVLTDGDVRRALLSGATLEQPLKQYIRKVFLYVDECASRAEILDLMQARKIRHVPVIDKNGSLRGMHTLYSVLGSDLKPNWAVIMAGGKGTRLGKLTESMPKPMLKVAGKPILERLVLHLISYGIRRIFISVNHLSHIIEEYFGDGSRWGCSIEYLKEKEPLGTGGALSLLPETPSHPLVLMNGDLLLEADISQMLAFHETNSFYATMGVHCYSHEVPFGCVEIDGNRMIGLEEKPLLTKIINSGVYMLSPEVVQSIPEKTFFPATRIFEEALAVRRPCGAYPLDGDWIDIGMPDQLKQARGSA